MKHIWKWTLGALLLLCACRSNGQMPIFRNSFTTNVPGAYVRGNLTFGNDPTTAMIVYSTFTNWSTAFFGGGTSYFEDGIQVKLNSTFWNSLLVSNLLQVVGTIQATNILIDPPLWDDVRIPLSNLSSPAAQPGRVQFTGGLILYGFDDSSTEQLNFELQVPHGVNTNNLYGIRLHLHWTCTNAIAAANSNVVWGLEYNIANVGAVYPTTTVTNTVTNAIPAVRFHQIAPLVTITNWKESAVISGRLFRLGGDGGDTYTGDAMGLSLDAHIPMRSLGSVKELGDY